MCSLRHQVGGRAGERNTHFNCREKSSVMSSSSQLSSHRCFVSPFPWAASVWSSGQSDGFGQLPFFFGNAPRLFSSKERCRGGRGYVYHRRGSPRIRRPRLARWSFVLVSSPRWVGVRAWRLKPFCGIGVGETRGSVCEMYVLRWREGVGGAECLLEMMEMVDGLLDW